MAPVPDLVPYLTLEFAGCISDGQLTAMLHLFCLLKHPLIGQSMLISANGAIPDAFREMLGYRKDPCFGQLREVSVRVVEISLRYGESCGGGSWLNLGWINDMLTPVIDESQVRSAYKNG